MMLLIILHFLYLPQSSSSLFKSKKTWCRGQTTSSQCYQLCQADTTVG